MKLVALIKFIILIDCSNIVNSDNDGDRNNDEPLLFDDPGFTSSIKPGATECSSKHALCDFWAKAGECVTSAKFMGEYCSGSCEPSCNGKSRVADGTVQCEDYIQACSFWSSKGECQKNPSYMLWQCPKSCHPKCGGGGNKTGNGTSGEPKDGGQSAVAPVKFSIKVISKGKGGESKGSSNGTFAAVKRTDRIEKELLAWRPNPDDGNGDDASKASNTVIRVHQGRKLVLRKKSRIPKINKSLSITTVGGDAFPTTTKKWTPEKFFPSRRTTVKSKSKNRTVKLSLSSTTAVSGDKSLPTPFTWPPGFTPLSPIHVRLPDSELLLQNSHKVKTVSKKSRIPLARGAQPYKLRRRAFAVINKVNSENSDNESNLRKTPT